MTAGWTLIRRYVLALPRQGAGNEAAVTATSVPPLSGGPGSHGSAAAHAFTLVLHPLTVITWWPLPRPGHPALTAFGGSRAPHYVVNIAAVSPDADGLAADRTWNTGRSFATRLAAVFDFEADQLVCDGCIWTSATLPAGSPSPDLVRLPRTVVCPACARPRPTPASGLGVRFPRGAPARSSTGDPPLGHPIDVQVTWSRCPAPCARSRSTHPRSPPPRRRRGRRSARRSARGWTPLRVPVRPRSTVCRRQCRG